MDVSKITAIVKLIETGHQHEEAGKQREAVKAYADAYKGMQDTLVEVHALWVDAYQEMTRQAGPGFESTIPQAAEPTAEKEELSDTIDDFEQAIQEEAPQTQVIADEAPADAYNVLEVSNEDVADRGLSFKSVRSNPFAQAAKDLAAAVVEAATDVAAAVVDVRNRKSETDHIEESRVAEDIPSSGIDEEAQVSLEAESEDGVRLEQEQPKFHVYEKNTADHKIAVLESLLEQVRARKNP